MTFTYSDCDYITVRSGGQVPHGERRGDNREGNFGVQSHPRRAATIPSLELELSCSHIRPTPERTTRLAQDAAKGDAVSRRLFGPQDDGEKPPRERRPLTSDNRARPAPRRVIKLIPPPAEDPSTIRRAT